MWRHFNKQKWVMPQRPLKDIAVMAKGQRFSLVWRLVCDRPGMAFTLKFTCGADECESRTSFASLKQISHATGLKGGE